MRTDIIGGFVAVLLLSVLFLSCKKRSQDISSVNECYANLRQIGGAFGNFAIEHNGKLPMHVSRAEGGTAELANSPSSAYTHFTPLSNWFATPLVLKCPNDLRGPATHWGYLQNTNVSYFVGLDANYNDSTSILSGDRGINCDPLPVSSFPTRTAVSWNGTNASHGGEGYLLFGDGSVRRVKNDELQRFLTNTTSKAFRLAFPVNY